MGSKCLPPNKENHLRLKNLFIREYLWNLSFTIDTLLKLQPSWEGVFFKLRMCLFGKIEISSKLCFLKNMVQKDSLLTKKITSD